MKIEETKEKKEESKKGIKKEIKQKIKKEIKEGKKEEEEKNIGLKDNIKGFNEKEPNKYFKYTAFKKIMEFLNKELDI